MTRVINPMLALLGVTAAMSIKRRLRQPYTPSQSVLADAHEAALREDWNRTIERRKERRKEEKRAKRYQQLVLDGLVEHRVIYQHGGGK